MFLKWSFVDTFEGWKWRNQYCNLTCGTRPCFSGVSKAIGLLGDVDLTSGMWKINNKHIWHHQQEGKRCSLLLSQIKTSLIKTPLLIKTIISLLKSAFSLTPNTVEQSSKNQSELCYHQQQPVHQQGNGSRLLIGPHSTGTQLAAPASFRSHPHRLSNIIKTSRA